MSTIDKINDYIHEQILMGKKDIVINLANYTNILTVPIIIIPSEISSITFNQSTNDSTFYQFELFTDIRSTDLSIFINNIKVNSQSSIAFDLRGYMNSNYTTYLTFSGYNIIKSEERSGINTAAHDVTIMGTTQSDRLIVYGGASYRSAAIGNSVLSPYTGSLVFKGYGTVEAYGGDGGGKDNSPSETNGLDGGYGIGFCISTSYPTSIIITDYINVLATGGSGQNIQSLSGMLYTDVEAGQGGNGISTGVCGKIIKSSSGILTSIGGNGGDILDESYGNAGNGGSALIINGGEINLNSTSTLIGGKGGSGSIGGRGGNSITVLRKNTSSDCQTNYVSLKNNITVSSGNGGDGSTSIGTDLNLVGGNGGQGGNIIDLGDSKTIVVADSLKGNIGSGGNGGSPYDDYPDFIDPSAVAGNGGNTGQYLKGSQVLDDSNGKTINIHSGTAGAPGRIQPVGGVIISGIPGSVLNPIQIDESLKAPVRFEIPAFAVNALTSTSENIMISQRLNYNLQLLEIELQKNYDSSMPIIYGEAVMSLISKIAITQYKNRSIAVYSNKN